MKNKGVRPKNGIIVMAIILFSLIILISISTKNSSNADTESNAETTSSYDSDDNDTDTQELASSNTDSSSSSSINNFSTDSQTSSANLKADVSIMPKENYENIENEVLKKADFDPTGNNPSAAYQIDGIMIALKTFKS